MICKNVDVIAVTVLLMGLVFANSLRDSRIVQVVSAGTMILPDRLCQAVVNVITPPPIRWRSF